MRYVMAFAASRRGPLVLGDGVTRSLVSVECRRTALELMRGIVPPGSRSCAPRARGVARGWSGRELARWLATSYAHATRHSARGERINVSGRATVDRRALDELLSRTHERLLRDLEEAARQDGPLDLAEEMVGGGFVRRAVDQAGVDVWVPIDGLRMKLRDRVATLFVADYLNDPASYRSLYVCARCREVVFDEWAKTSGVCPLAS